MKLLASAEDRPQDDADARALLKECDDVERARARDAARRIEALGANRGKPLTAILERLLAGA